MLIKLNIKYGSKEAVELCDKVGTYLNYYGMLATSKIGKEKGCYDDFNKNEVLDTLYYKQQSVSIKRYFDYTPEQNLRKNYYPRNSQLFTIAPTGTISTMIGVSGGIEPIFANYYERTTKSLHGKDVKYKVYTPIVKEYIEKHNLEDDKQLPEYFVCSADIPVEDRIAMQAVWQTHIDASISSTVNLPNSATIEDVEKIYMDAWKAGLKGITIYRAGCAREGILTTNSASENNNSTPDKVNSQSLTLKRGDIIECSSDLIGRKDKIINGCGTTHILAFFDPLNGALMEVYLSKGSQGGCGNYMVGLSRMISLLCRAGVNIFDIVDQLDSTGACPSYAVRRATKKDTSPGSCCPMAIGKKLLEMYQDVQVEFFGKEDKPEQKQKKIEKPVKIVPSKALCPECGEPLVFEGGCNSCKNCGYSKCS